MVPLALLPPPPLHVPALAVGVKRLVMLVRQQLLLLVLQGRDGAVAGWEAWHGPGVCVCWGGEGGGGGGGGPGGRAPVAAAAAAGARVCSRPFDPCSSRCPGVAR